MTATFTPGERPRPAWLREHPRAWAAAVATVCFGAFMGQLDASVVTLTYRPIGHQFRAGLGIVQWVSLAYLIALAGLLVPVGRISDRLGRKRVYLWGFTLFALASLGCALAPNLPALVGLRAVQGAGAAMLQANSIALVATAAPRRRLRTALGIQAAAQAIGLAIGPTVGGLLVQTVGWRWVFAINVPIGFIAVIAGRYLLPRTRWAASSARRPTKRRVRAVLGIRGVPAGLAGAFGSYLVLFGPIVLVPDLLQGRGRSPLGAGLVVAALPVGFAIAAALADRVLTRQRSSTWRCRLGLTVAVAALLGLLFARSSVGADAVSLGVLGLGLGCATPANNALVMGSIPAHVAALGGGLVSAARAIGTAAGTALVAGALTLSAGGSLAVLLLIAVTLATLLTTAGRPVRSAY